MAKDKKQRVTDAAQQISGVTEPEGAPLANAILDDSWVVEGLVGIAVDALQDMRPREEAPATYERYQREMERRRPGESDDAWAESYRAYLAMRALPPGPSAQGSPKPASTAPLVAAEGPEQVPLDDADLDDLESDEHE